MNEITVHKNRIWTFASKSLKASMLTTMTVAVALSVTTLAHAQDAVIEEIMVTAQKRAQSAQDVDISITVFSERDLDELGIKQPVDLAAQTPGMNIKNVFGNSNPVVTIRGIGMNDHTVNTAPSAAIYVDEVSLGSPALLSLQMFDVERVEVLKGPQGTLFGRNTTAGVLSITTKGASQEFEGYADVSYGNFNSLKTEFAIGGGLTENLAGRFAFTTEQSDGHQKLYGTEAIAGFSVDPKVPPIPLVADDSDYAGVDIFAWRGSLTWTPSDTVDVDLRIHGSQDSSESYLKYLDGVYGGFVAPVPGDHYSAWSNMRPKMDADALGGSLIINADLGAVTLTSVTGYEAMDRLMEDDDGLPHRQGESAYREDLWQWTQEVRLTSNSDGNFNWIVGAFYSKDEIDFFRTLDYSDWQRFGPGTTLTSTVIAVDYLQEGESAAVFGHTEWQFQPNWMLTLGLRYTDEDKRLKGWSNDLNPYGLSVLGRVYGLPIAYDNKYNVSNFSGKVAIDWTPNDDVLFYLSASQGFKSGGFDGSTILNIDAAKPYKEETVLAYELGFKSMFMGGKMQLNGAVYYYDYQDMQVSQLVETLGGIDSVRSNADDTTVYGAELDMWLKPTEGLDIKAGISLLDSEIKVWTNDFSGCAILPGGEIDPTCRIYIEAMDRKGNQVPEAPELSFNGLVRYEWDLSANLSMVALVDTSFNDDIFKEVSNTYKTESYWLTNARLYLKSQTGAWEVSLWVKNLADKEYLTNLIPPGAGAVWEYYGMPRTYGVSARYNW